MSIQPFSDEKVAFLFHVYKEFELAKRLISQLRFFFPLSNILGIADGTYNYEFKEFAWQHNVRYIEAERLFRQETGNQWVKRMFWFYTASSHADYLIKIDPDAYVLRRFNFLPHLDIAGTPFTLANKVTFIHGGCALYSRQAADAILNTNLINDEEYRKNSAFSYRRFMPPYKRRDEQPETFKCMCEDRIIGDLEQKLGLKMGEWNEIYADQTEKNPNDYADMKYAVIHAVKTLAP